MACLLPTVLAGTQGTAQSGILTCTSCTVGTHQTELVAIANVNALTCKPCDDGYWTNRTGTVNCDPCPLGTAGGGIDNICTPGLPGSIADRVGTSIATGCAKCPAGTYEVG